MKRFFPVTMAVTLLALSAPLLVAPAMAAPICLSTRNMTSTTEQDNGTALLIKMRDGSAWRNDLQGRCPDLRFNGFAWATANPGAKVCENEHIIAVFRSGQVCRLGHFTQVTPPRG